MSSQTRNERGDANRLDVRTLVIASLSAAVAAVVVSRIWAAGTPIAAAATPVFVTVLKELLDRPTAKIAEKVTVQARALPDTRIREPAASHVGRDASMDEAPTRPVEPTEPVGAEAGRDPSDIRVYRQPPRNRVSRRIHPKVVAITAALAFLIAGVLVTAGQLAIGNPFGHDGNGAIILGQHKKKSSSSQDTQQQQNTTTEQQQTTPQQTTPDAQQQAPVTPEPDKQKQSTETTPQTTPEGGTQTTPGGTTQP